MKDIFPTGQGIERNRLFQLEPRNIGSHRSACTDSYNGHQRWANYRCRTDFDRIDDFSRITDDRRNITTHIIGGIHCGNGYAG